MGIPRPGGGYVAPGKNYVLNYIVVHQCRMPKRQTGLCLFMPLSVYAPYLSASFRLCPFPVWQILNSAKFFSASFHLCPFPVWQILNSAKFLSASFCLCPSPVWQILDYVSFLYVFFLYASFRFCPFPFLPLSVYAPFRIDGNSRLCRIPLCQLPASPFGNGRMGFFYSASSSSIRPKSAIMADKSATWQP
jgi:hypothetical protein